MRDEWLLNRESALEKMNTLGGKAIPFLFILNFDCSQGIVMPLAMADIKEVFFNIKGIHNDSPEPAGLPESFVFRKFPVPFETYASAFVKAQQSLQKGDSYLVNLTFPTPIETNISLMDIYHLSEAKYKLCLPNWFVVFSPETFVRIENGHIWSHPMKGTIDADVPNASETILDNPKELAEHVTIVDLIRNDMSMVSRDVVVEKFRYIDLICSQQKNLLQVSSQIRGTLEADYHKRIGDIMFAMMPAGSVTGAPKAKTVEIIRRIEGYDRGFYTGVFGIFDGKNLDSAVMIRFIERSGNSCLFKSGGGITIYSEVEKEYQELIDKVYAPIVGNDKSVERPVV